ncbi:MAG: disulfide bond formation protein B [Gammaproteobacteria bacterium]|nr:disulfide bond formation protein B [Gammaproteobacteria bacterium]MDH4313307.1 disulfide bond formation protein B [Gammaproteobacteria bacterium]MDH5212892.1 disulfide bond formation protein B [Gammaproteobacteria bacterium]MDH5500385.1 disulfide bond formation protein B [Gammaproteobacteria bacterium]
MTIPGRRSLNLLGFLACGAMMAYALYVEHVLLLVPCPLCVMQRLAVISLGIVFLVAALHGTDRAGRHVYGALIVLATLAGAGVAAWHVRLQHLPADQVPSCGPGLDYMLESFPLSDVLKMIFSGSGECASIDWQLLGLSMPAWVLIAIVTVGAAGAWNNFRRT